eukprot:COSAG04_NODE_4966_length_1801_cov_1.918331_4_plen_61_part_01
MALKVHSLIDPKTFKQLFALVPFSFKPSRVLRRKQKSRKSCKLHLVIRLVLGLPGLQEALK